MFNPTLFCQDKTYLPTVRFIHHSWHQSRSDTRTAQRTSRPSSILNCLIFNQATNSTTTTRRLQLSRSRALETLQTRTSRRRVSNSFTPHRSINHFMDHPTAPWPVQLISTTQTLCLALRLHTRPEIQLISLRMDPQTRTISIQDTIIVSLHSAIATLGRTFTRTRPRATKQLRQHKLPPLFLKQLLIRPHLTLHKHQQLLLLSQIIRSTFTHQRTISLQLITNKMRLN